MRIAQLAMLLVLTVSCRATPEHPVPDTQIEYVNTQEGFSLRVPQGWTVQDTNYSIAHYTDVFLLGRNPKSKLSAAVELPEGAVDVIFFHPGFPRMACEFREDSVGDSVRAMLDTLKATWQSSHGVSWYEVGFWKWNEWWGIRALGHRPQEVDRQAVHGLVRSMVFAGTPVTLEKQALQFAYKSLPVEARTPRSPCLGFVPLMTTVVQRGNTFLVAFQAVDEAGLSGQLPSPGPFPRWSFVVRSDGTVEPAR